MECSDRYSFQQSNLRSIYAAQTNQSDLILLNPCNQLLNNLQFEFGTRFSYFKYTHIISFSINTRNKIQTIIRGPQSASYLIVILFNQLKFKNIRQLLYSLYNLTDLDQSLATSHGCDPFSC